MEGGCLFFRVMRVLRVSVFCVFCVCRLDTMPGSIIKHNFGYASLLPLCRYIPFLACTCVGQLHYTRLPIKHFFTGIHALPWLQ